MEEEKKESTELKITSLGQVKTILSRMIELMEGGDSNSEEEESTNEEKPEDSEDKDETEKSANVVDKLISTIHSSFTQQADWLYGDGAYSQEDRIALSNAIGSALDTFNAVIDNTVPHLRTVDPNTIYKSDEVNFEAKTEMLSKAEFERVAYSVVYPAMPIGWKDTQSDYIRPEEIQKMAWDWMVNSGKYDIHHRVLNVAKEDASVVESFIAPVDIDWPIGNDTYKRINKGSWIVATKFSSGLWEKVQSGELNAYSIRGKARRKQLTQ